MYTSALVLLFLTGIVSCDDQAHASLPAAQSPTAPVAPYYPEENSQYYPDYGYPAQSSFADPNFSSPLDRQGGLETLIAAPVVITAFAAALLGGFLSPLITEGLSRLGEYEIEWPEVKRKVVASTEESEARSVDSFSWIEALDKINDALSEQRTKRSTSNAFNRFLRR